MERDYTGWSNYATCTVKRWIDRRQGDYEYWKERARDCDNANQLAQELKDTIEDANPLAETASMFSDLLGAALCDVNWHEIAVAMLSDY